MKQRHKWSLNDDVVTFGLHRLGENGLGITQAEVAAQRGIKPGSLRMRIQNFASLSSGGSLDHTAKLTREVYAQFGALTDAELRERVKLALAA